MTSYLANQKEARDRHYQCSIVLHAPLDEVFHFFSDARNLERITPPWLNFKILGQSTPSIEEGTEFDYRLRIHGFPIYWKSRILQWNLNERFVDTQLSGPYQKWYHLHLFWAEGDRTRMQDEVLYRLPLGCLGDRLAGWWVDRDVKRIFEYRAKTISTIFGSS